MESDLWLYGLSDLLAKSGCLELGCPLVVFGETGDPERSDRLVLVHRGGPRVEVNLDTIKALGRRDQLGITGNLVTRLKAAHAEPAADEPSYSSAVPGAEG